MEVVSLFLILYKYADRYIIASIYSKPGSRKKTILLDHINSTYQLLSAKDQNTHWIMAEDFNNLKPENILSLSPQLKQLVKGKTRENPAAIFDLVITDIHPFYHDAQIIDPLEVDINKVDHNSDHNMVIV